MLEFKSDIGSITTKAGSFILKRKSPLFSNESIEGDITFPSAIPMTPELRAWLNHPDRPEGVYKRLSKRIQLFRNGTPIIVGDLLLGDADEDSIETTLLCGSSPFAAVIKDLCLDELDLGYQSFNSEAELLAYWNGSVTGNTFTHPYYLPSIISDSTGHFNYWFDGYKLTYSGDNTYMAPMLYYSWLLPKLFESFGYELEDKVFINHPELRDMLFFSMHNVNSQEDPLIIHYADLLPHYKLSTWLIDIQNAFGVKFIFDSNKQKVTLDWQVSAISNIPKAKTFPHKKIKMKALDERPSKFSYNLNDEQSIWPIAENMLSAIWERKDLPYPADYPNKYIYVGQEDQTYRFIFDVATQKYVAYPVAKLEDAFGMFGYPPRNYLANFSIGDNSDQALSFNSNIHPLHPSYPTGLMKNFSLLAEDAKSIMPYVLFAKHSVDVANNWVEGDYYLNDFSFTWPKSTWLLQNKLLPWWEFLKNSKPLEDTLLLSDVELANWDWTIPVQIGNVPCLVDEMDIEISAEADLMEVKILAHTM